MHESADGAQYLVECGCASAPLGKNQDLVRVDRDCIDLQSGKLFTCLFAADGHDVRGLLRGGAGDDDVRAAVAGIWTERKDRYSEERGLVARPKAEMSYLGG